MITIFSQVINGVFSQESLNIGLKIGKFNGLLKIHSINNDDRQFSFNKKELSAGQSVYGVAHFNVNKVFGIADTEQKLESVLPSARLSYNALVFDLLEDPIIINNKTSNDVLIKKVKEIFLTFNQTNFADTQSYSSAVVTLFLPDKIVVAHIGDSRAVSSDLNSIMTHDHKPFLLYEKKRIEKAGGIVQNNTLFQKDNNQFLGWSVSRMFGNTKLAGITAEPDVSIFDYNFKILATTSHDLNTEFFPVAQSLKKMDLPLYAKNKATTKKGNNNTKASSGYRFIIIANNDVWKSLPTRIQDYFSWDFGACSNATDEDKNNVNNKVLIDYHCNRLGTAEIATHIVESVLTRYGLTDKSLDLATELLHVATVQKEKFNLSSLINPEIVQKKSFFQKIKGWFLKQKTTKEIIVKEIDKIQNDQSIVIIAWDPKKEPQKKLKTKLSRKKIK